MLEPSRRPVSARLGAAPGGGVWSFGQGELRALWSGLARRRFLPVGAGRNPRTLVFEDDAARAVLLAASKLEAGGQIFNVTDGEIHTVGEIIAAIAAALGRKAPSLHAAGGRGVVGGQRPQKRPAGPSGGHHRSRVRRWTKYLEDVAVAGQRLRDTLGFQPQWGLEQGWRHTIHELRRQGRL